VSNKKLTIVELPMSKTTCTQCMSRSSKS